MATPPYTPSHAATFPLQAGIFCIHLACPPLLTFFPLHVSNSSLDPRRCGAQAAYRALAGAGVFHQTIFENQSVKCSMGQRRQLSLVFTDTWEVKHRPRNSLWREFFTGLTTWLTNEGAIHPIHASYYTSSVHIQYSDRGEPALNLRMKPHRRKLA